MTTPTTPAASASRSPSPRASRSPAGATGDRVRIRSETEPAVADLPLDIAEPAAVEPAWARYVAAVVAELRPAVGLDAEITSDLPQGVGLSSSAALEVAVALALGADTSDPLALAQLCRAAEHAARQVPTGILDQLASICGRAGHGLLIDCRSLDVTPVPLPPSDEVEWRVITPARGRDLAASQYADRVAELGPRRGGRSGRCVTRASATSMSSTTRSCAPVPAT